MKDLNLKDKILRLLEIIKSKHNTKIISFLICVVIATCLWFLNSLSKEYTVNISYPVQYTNIPKDKLLINKLPNNFTLLVKAGGFAILRHKMNMAFTPLIINLYEFPQLNNQNDSINYLRISTNKISNYIASQVSNDLSVINILPDSLEFHFDKLIERKLKIEPNITYTLAKQYFASNNIAFEPEYITVKGPATTLDTIFTIKTEKQHYNKLKTTTKRNIGLQQIENLSYSPKRVVMIIPIEEFTEKQLEIPIQIINKPEDIDIKLFPDKIKISFLVSLNKFSEVSVNDFIASVNYSEILDNNELLNTNLSYELDYVNSIKISPKTIEYIIQNNISTND